jgi:hypothetical protein
MFLSLVGILIAAIIGFAIWALVRPPLYNPLIAVAVLLVGILEALVHFGQNANLH